MENIVAGKPQTVSSTEVSLAMSSWHLYPDLEVLHSSRKMVKQDDKLITPGGIVTIGLQNSAITDKFGISWSLPLSHLRYYGEGIISKATVNSSHSRVSMPQLIMVAFGCITSSWAKTAQEMDVCLQIFLEFNKKLKRCEDRIPEWFAILCRAGRIYGDADEATRADLILLIRLGGRRCWKFLTNDKMDFEPWFGLHSLGAITDIIKGHERKLRALRVRYRIINQVEKE